MPPTDVGTERPGGINVGRNRRATRAAKRRDFGAALEL
jgi:hypothetical protein